MLLRLFICLFLNIISECAHKNIKLIIETVEKV